MAEIKREPVKILIGDTVYDAFDEDHTIADIFRWLVKMNCAEEMEYLLYESKVNNG